QVLGSVEEARRYLALFERKNQQAIAAEHGMRRENSILDTADEHHQRGLRFLQQGDRRQAELEFRIALERDPAHGPARRDLRTLGAR
ncbi:MAG TPA: hypothetical protein VK689_06565, partial [Armatimonadota bacterium]|nr:hypothetical protein [Armatimonadota bacterium]